MEPNQISDGRLPSSTKRGDNAGAVTNTLPSSAAVSDLQTAGRERASLRLTRTTIKSQLKKHKKNWGYLVHEWLICVACYW